MVHTIYIQYTYEQVVIYENLSGCMWSSSDADNRNLQCFGYFLGDYRGHTFYHYNITSTSFHIIKQIPTFSILYFIKSLPSANAPASCKLNASSNIALAFTAVRP